MDGKGKAAPGSTAANVVSGSRERPAARLRVPHSEAAAAGDRQQPEPQPPTGAVAGSKNPDKAKRPVKKQDSTPAKKRPEGGPAAVPKATNEDQWKWIKILTASRAWLALVVTQIVAALYFVFPLGSSSSAHGLPAAPLAPAPVGRYAEDWSSLDSRPLPAWYDEAKIGLFVHWGLFSVPAFYSEWFWWHWEMNRTAPYREFMARNYPPGFSYADFAPRFKAQFFDADRWAELFKKSGVRYVVLTSKHHEGYTLWPSKVSWNWNAGDVGPRRDLVGELARAIRKKGGMRFGLYYSLYEWFNPLYQRDKAACWATDEYVKAKVSPELRDIVESYRPDVIWSDGDWEAPDSYWKSQQFLAWLYNESPVRESVVVNDRWGKNTSGRHGDVYTCEDHYNPGKLVLHKWENALPLDKGDKKAGGAFWGHRKNLQLSDLLSIEELIEELVSTVSCNGNLLFNIGPASDGTIPLVFEERLTQLGAWLGVNGEAVYGSRPWKHQKDTLAPHVWYTSKAGEASTSVTVYVFLLKWPKGSKLSLGSLRLARDAEITMLGVPNVTLSASLEKHDGTAGGQALVVTLPCLTPDMVPTPWAWVLRVEGAL